MTSLVDRVARVIGAGTMCSNYHGPHSPMPCDIFCTCVDAARAAIAAMREPTEGMVDAGAASFPVEGFGRVSVSGQPSAAWRAMVDAALEVGDG